MVDGFSDAEVEALAAEMGMDVQSSSGEGGGENKASGEMTIDDVTTKTSNQEGSEGGEGRDGAGTEERKENNSGGANKTPSTGGGGGGGGGKKSKKKKKKGDIE